MTYDEAIAVFSVICILVIWWRVREEARETRLHLDDMESRLRQRFEQLEGEFAELRIKHFGLFKVRRPSRRAGEGTDWHWTVGEIEEEG
jgi:hypothetical protein